jgi:EF hand domain-containing protein
MSMRPTWPFQSIEAMRKTVLTAFTLTALVAAGAAFAGSGAMASGSTPAPDAAPHGNWHQQFFDKIDTNHDGIVSRAEYQAWIDSRFAKLDANGDGTVDADEVATSPMAAERVQKRAEGFVRRYDTSGSGQVSKSDFEAKEMQRFDRLSNGADSITEDQLATAHPFKHHRGPAPNDNGG